jgi:uncharacterized protein YndB with AHSA1/START domain
MGQKGEDRLEREVWINAKPETVWDFLTEPGKMILWMGVEAAAEAKPGGIYRVNITGKEIAAGQFLRATPHKHLIYTWGWEGEEALPPGKSKVEITLQEEKGGTRLRVVHSILPPDQVVGHGEGWDHYLERLSIAAPGGDPGPDSWCETGCTS